MPDAPILSNDDEFGSIPSERTIRGGIPGAIGRIDHYDLLRKLGGGGFGVVYLAKDTASGIDVAIKTLHPLLKNNTEEMGRLREKFALVSRLAHPNIATALVLHPCRDIQVWDESARGELGLQSGDSVMVMRYAPGATLSKWRRQFPGGVVPFDLALEVGRQVAAALDYAHGEKIVHRDIKPENIMVETLDAGLDGRDGPAGRPAQGPKVRVRILDFGLAVEIRSSMGRLSREQGDTSGTRPYMAPEQWLGKAQDGRADQYALACVLYELLSGEPPFAGVFETGDPMIMKSAVVGDPPEELENLPPPANAALLRALAKAPKDRFPTCGAFVEALARGAGREDTHAESAESGPPGELPRPGTQASRPRSDDAASGRKTGTCPRFIASCFCFVLSFCGLFCGIFGMALLTRFTFRLPPVLRYCADAILVLLIYWKRPYFVSVPWGTVFACIVAAPIVVYNFLWGCFFVYIPYPYPAVCSFLTAAGLCSSLYWKHPRFVPSFWGIVFSFESPPGAATTNRRGMELWNRLVLLGSSFCWFFFVWLGFLLFLELLVSPPYS